MKRQDTISSANDMHGEVPVFKSMNMQGEQSSDAAPQPATLSFFEIKELYDRAYAAVNEGREDYKAKEMMAEAIKMDMAYRCQLSRGSKYKKTSQINDFRIITHVA